MATYLLTIKEQIRDLNPQAYWEMAASGELDRILDEYREQVSTARSAAAREARKQVDQDDPIALTAAMNMAAISAQEIEMASIMEELDLLYGQTTHLSDSPEPKLDYEEVETASIMEEPAVLYGQATRLSDLPKPKVDYMEIEGRVFSNLHKDLEEAEERHKKNR